MKLIKKLDFFSHKVSLTMNNKGDLGYKTFIGGLISLLSFFVSIFCGIYFIIRMFNRKDLSVIYSTQMNPFVNLTYSNKLPFLIRVSDTNSLPYDEDEKLYYITSSVWFGGSNDTTLSGTASQTSQSLNISKCNLDVHFTEEYKPYFENFENLSSYYCIMPRNYSQTIYGLYGNYYPFSFYSFTFRYCKNTTENNNFCYSLEDSKTLLRSPYLDVIFIDYTMNSLNHKQVNEMGVRKERYELSVKLYKRIWLYLENIKYIIDKGYIFTYNEYEYFHRFDSVRIDPSIISENSTYFSTLTILNSVNTSIYNKQYTKFQDYVAIIGGLVKIVTMACAFLNHFNGLNSYYFRLIKDYVIDYNLNNIDNKKKNHNIHLTSSILGKSKNSQNILANSKNESGIILDNKKIQKFESFHLLNRSISTKFLPTMFISKKTKSAIAMYKEFINTRLNIINILKKLELIQLPDNLKKKPSINSNIANNPIKIVNRKVNNFINEN